MRGLTGLTLPLLPLAALVAAVHPRLRRHLSERLGAAAPVAPGVIWLHAASVGEVRVVEGLLPTLPPPILVTTDTDTGRAAAARLPGVYAQVCPIDHAWTLAPLWAEARPRLVGFIEGTFWPALAWQARRAGVPVWRIAAKASSRTRRAPRAWLRALWRPTDTAWARDEGEAAFLRTVHHDVRVLGNPKAWVAPPSGGLRFARPVVVGVSTRPGDESRLIDAVLELSPRPAVLIAPRHLDRVPDIVASVARDRGLVVARRRRVPRDVPSWVDVVVSDTLGDLAADLVGAAAAVIGGTFDPAIGGQSPFAAAAAGVPVLAGPARHAQGRAFDDVGAIAVTEASLSWRLAEVLGRPATPPLPTSAPPEAWAAAVARIGGPAPEASPRPWAWPAVGPWTAMTHLVRARRRPWRASVPVIAVGSVNARSPGRTALVRAMVRGLSEQGHRVGVVLRGYRRAQGRGVVVSRDPADVDRLGDEGAVHARAGAWVAAGPQRAEGVRRLVDQGVTIVVLDDGADRGDVAIDHRIEVVDARFPGARGPLPAGERRPRSTVPPDVVVATHVGAGFPAPSGAIALSRTPGPWMRGDEPASAPSGAVVAFAGIGRPVDFFDSLDDVDVAETVALGDHAPIDAATWAHLTARADGRALVTTGKDAARLTPSQRASVWWRDVEIDLPDAVLARVIER